MSNELLSSLHSGQRDLSALQRTWPDIRPNGLTLPLSDVYEVKAHESS